MPNPTDRKVEDVESPLSQSSTLFSISSKKTTTTVEPPPCLECLSPCRHDTIVPPLHTAILCHDSHAVVRLLEMGTEVDQRDQADQTGCHVAVRMNDARIVAALVRAGCNVNAVDDADRTPCHLAVLAGNEPLVDLLVGAGGKMHLSRDMNLNTVDLPSVDILTRAVVSARTGGSVGVESCCERDDVRRICELRGWPIPTRQEARTRVARGRLALVRWRALEVCVGLHTLRLDALSMCEILLAACGQSYTSIALTVPFHIFWRLAVTVKHFRWKRNLNRNFVI
jgi:hypothetical protein